MRINLIIAILKNSEKANIFKHFYWMMQLNLKFHFTLYEICCNNKELLVLVISSSDSWMDNPGFL